MAQRNSIVGITLRTIFISANQQPIRIHPVLKSSNIMQYHAVGVAPINCSHCYHIILAVNRPLACILSVLLRIYCYKMKVKGT